MAGVLLLAVTHRLDRLGARNLWPDEAHSLDLARRTLPEILTYLRSNDPHPVGYYALLSFWIRVVGQDLVWMRALSLVFGVAAIVLTWRLGRRLFSATVGVGAAALLALNPFQIFASNELRMYMPLEFLALLSTWTLWRARESADRHVWWVGYGASVALMLYVSYYAFPLIAGHALWIFLHRMRVTARQAGIAALTGLVLYAPWIPYLRYTAAILGSNPLGWRGQPIYATYVPELIASQTFGGYLFNMLSYHSFRGLDLEYFGMFLFLFLVLAAAGVFVLGRMNRPARSLIALCWLVPVILVVLISLAFGRVAAYAYHLNFLQPFLALFVAAGMIHLRDAVANAPGSLVALGAVLGVLAFMAPAVDNLQWNPDYQYYRFDRAARLVRDLYEPTDVVVYLPQGIHLNFEFYFDPPGKKLGVVMDLRQWTIESLRDSIRDVARSLTPADRRVWVVYSPPVPEGGMRELVTAITQQGYRLAIIHDYKGVDVGLLVRPLR